MKQYLKPRFFDPESKKNNCEAFWQREAQITKMQAESPYPCMHYFGALKLPVNNDYEYYLFLEFIKGDTLDHWYTQRWTENTPMTLPQMKEIINQILVPLLKHIQFVHNLGIIHRDITAQNILIVGMWPEFYPVLIDWGVAKIIPLSEIDNISKPYFTDAKSNATSIMNQGTPPELRGGYEPNCASDIYMIGHLLYYLFNRGQTRSMPMTRDDYTITPDKCIPELPAGIATVIERATYYEPADRIPIGELISDLTEISDNLELPEAIEPPVTSKVMDSSTTPAETMKLLQDFTKLNHLLTVLEGQFKAEIITDDIYEAKKATLKTELKKLMTVLDLKGIHYDV